MINQEVHEQLADLLEELGEKTVYDMVNLLKSKNKIATGNLIKSFDYVVLEKGVDVMLEIGYADYGTYVDEGRKPGSFPQIAPLKRWAKIKGFPESAAWGVATNIKKYGIKATNFTRYWESNLKKLQNSDGFSKAVQTAIDNMVDDFNNTK